MSTATTTRRPTSGMHIPTLPHRLPAPQNEPPLEGEPTSGAGQVLSTRARSLTQGDANPDALAGVQGTLALAFVLPSGVPAVPQPPRLRLVPRPAGAPDALSTVDTPQDAAQDEEDEDDPRRRPTPSALLPDARGWSGRFVQAVLEVLGGERPVSQLVRWTDADVLAQVQRRAARRTTSGPAHRPRSVLRSVRVSQPRDGVAEVTAVVEGAGRFRALALRLDGVGGRWQCTALELG